MKSVGRGMGRVAVGALMALVSVAACAQREVKPTADLRVLFIDVEGGQATLFIAPDGTSLLVDTGWEGHDGRDADRIATRARAEGLRRIDYVLLTHYHEDHAGGVPQLAARMPLGTLIDHGANRELDHGITEQIYADYQKVVASKGMKHIVAHAGETLPIAGMTVRVISADGTVIPAALPGAGQANPYCATTETRPMDETENARSLGIEVTFGKLKILDLGDLTWNKEKELMCPQNRLGHEDVLIVSHHGWNQSSSPALVDAVSARVEIMDNGAIKGGSHETMATLLAAPAQPDLWQLHFSLEAGVSGNSKADYIANPQQVEDAAKDEAFGLKLIGSRNGDVQVRNLRNDFVKVYPAGRAAVASR